MKIGTIAQSPPPQVKSTATVFEAVRAMQNARGGAVVIADDGRIAGIFTERDVMLRVVAAGRDAETTLLREVMTAPVETVAAGSGAIEVLHLMVSRHIRHLPVVGEDGRLVSLVSLRNILINHLDQLKDR